MRTKIELFFSTILKRTHVQHDTRIDTNTRPKSYQESIRPNSKKDVFASKYIAKIKVGEPHNNRKTTLKSIKKSNKKTIKFWMDCLMVFGSILASFAT